MRQECKFLAPKQQESIMWANRSIGKVVVFAAIVCVLQCIWNVTPFSTGQKVRKVKNGQREDERVRVLKATCNPCVYWSTPDYCFNWNIMEVTFDVPILFRQDWGGCRREGPPINAFARKGPRLVTQGLKK